VARTHYWQDTEARSVLGYRPRVTRKEGLRRMYAYFESDLIAKQFPARYQTFKRRVVFVFTALLVLVCIWLAKPSTLIF
jgi:hypothetical protein